MDSFAVRKIGSTTLILINILVTLTLVSSSTSQINLENLKPGRFNIKNDSDSGRDLAAMDQTWVTGNVWSLWSVALATVFIMGGLGMVVYYFYYINMFGYSGDGYPNNITFNRPVGRSLSILGSNWAEILEGIIKAQEFYNNWQSISSTK